MKKIIILLPILFFLSFLASAQLTDDFLDGDFTNNPTWLGDDTRFQITSQELQLNDVNYDSPVSSLYLSAPTQGATTWEFYVRLDFNPSSTNYTRIYLASDQADFTGSLNGYFVLVGGTTDRVELRKQTGTTTTAIISSLDDVVDVAAPQVRVRVTRDASDNWDLLVDYAGGTNYVSQGTAMDGDHTMGTFYGLRCNYTSTRKDKFFFDDFYVNPIFADNTAPELMSAVANSATEIVITFNEPIDPTSAANPANFTIDGGLTIASSMIDPNDGNSVIITLSAPMSNLTNYNIGATATDLGGNAADGSTIPFQYLIADAAVAFDIIINEIHADPTPIVGLPDAEFVELYNRSNKVLDLADYIISSGGAGDQMPAYILLAGEYVVVADNNDVAAFNALGITNIVGVPTMEALSENDNVTISDLGGTIINSVDYLEAWYQTPGTSEGGWTLELINPDNLCANPADNWIDSNNPTGGTPGVQNSRYDASTTAVLQVVNAVVLEDGTIELTYNSLVDVADAEDAANYSIDNGLGTPTSVGMSSPTSVIITPSSALVGNTEYTITVTGINDCSGLNSIDTNANTAMFFVTEPAEPFDLMINEIMADPSPPVVLPDAEYIEIYNRSTKAINLENYTVSSGSTPQLLPQYVIFPGEYVVVCDDEYLVNFQNLAITNVIGVSSFPSLSNAGDEIILTDELGMLINSVNFSSTWYQDEIKDNGGYSLELINPNNPCDISLGNWRASNSSTGGTPGAENSIYDISTSEPPLQVLSADFLNPSQVEVVFSSSIDGIDAMDPSNYSVDNSVGNPSMANLSSANTVVLDFATALSGNIIYTLTVTGVNNCTGAISIDINNNTASFSLPEPMVLNAIIQEPSQIVVVTYDVPMNPATVGNSANYSIDGVNPTAVNVISALVVELTFGTPFTNGITYDLEIENVTNLDGTKIIPTSVPLVYYIPVAIERFDIIINEFMPDPTESAGLPEGEFVELYNRSGKTISVEGFTLQSGTSSSSPLPFIVLNRLPYCL